MNYYLKDNFLLEKSFDWYLLYYCIWVFSFTFKAAPTVVTISKQPVGPVNYNSSVTFNGSYTSNLLRVTIKWQKLTGGNSIDIDITTDKYTGSSVTGPSPQLKINQVKLIDEASYILEVSNGVGSTSSNFISLNVIGGLYNSL